MAKRISLREFQQHVTERLQNLSMAQAAATRLGLRVGGDNWLVTLTDVSEVMPVPLLASTPRTLSWFRGVANVRGNLVAVTDFSLFMGGEATPLNMDSRIVLAHPKYGINAGLMVNRMLGLRNPDGFRRIEDALLQHPWESAVYEDEQGTRWRELNLPVLLAQDNFLNIGR